LFDSYYAYAPGFTGGVRVAAGDADATGFFTEVLTGPGAPGGSHVVVFGDDSDAGAQLGDNPPVDQFVAYPPGYSAGVFVAFGKLRTASYAAAESTPLVDEAIAFSFITVPAGAGLIRDLDVSLAIDHVTNSDLFVRLTHLASGVQVILFSHVGHDDNGI